MTITIPDRIRIAAPPEVTEWGFRVVARDRSTRHGYRWAAPGEWATAPGPINDANRGACPTGVGDGICVARTWRGVYVQGYRWDRIMLVGWSPVDVLGDETDKVRLRRAWVGGILTIGAAYLRDADLRGADLRGADLDGADLRGADLRGADLRGANLGGADLDGAYLRGADLRDANLDGAYLRGANLRGAYLRDANLDGADLRGANLGGAYLRGADLRGAWRFEEDHAVAGWRIVNGRLRRDEA